MYMFICRGELPHFSHSAAKKTNDDTCPVCGAETKLILESEEEKGRLAREHHLNDIQLFELAADLVNRRGYSETDTAYILRLEVGELRRLRNRITVDIGKTTRRRATELKEKEYSNAVIAQELGLNENRVRELLEPRRSGHGNN